MLIKKIVILLYIHINNFILKLIIFFTDNEFYNKKIYFKLNYHKQLQQLKQEHNS